ncbi:MAG: hypothetical protein E6Q97_18025 [Desulfurellales bacterium]|nr:MAG: hypothetical protein E6Q97_18025 [Desulfurellales bacterium]
MSQDVKTMTMEEVTSFVHQSEDQLGLPRTESFKSLGAARMRALKLQSELNQPQGNTMIEDQGTAPAPEVAPEVAVDKSKYDTSARRGPNLGTGAYAKQRIREGADNKTILAEIREKFPDANTSASSIAFYRNAVKKESVPKTGDEYRAEAAKMRELALELDAKAQAADEAAAKAAEQAAAPAAE